MHDAYIEIFLMPIELFKQDGRITRYRVILKL